MPSVPGRIAAILREQRASSCASAAHEGTSQKVPTFELGERRIQSDRNRHHRASRSQIIVGLPLSSCQMTAGRLQLEPKDRSVSDCHHVRNAGTDAKALQDRGFDRRPPATIRNVESEELRHWASSQMGEHCPLDCVLRPAAHFASGKSSASLSSATPSGPEALPSRLRVSACRIVSLATPDCSAMLATIAASLALVKRAEQILLAHDQHRAQIASLRSEMGLDVAERQVNDLYAAAKALVEQIIETPVLTIDGMRAKANALIAWWNWEEGAEAPEDDEQRMMASIINDLVA
jgi:hypothetical protein